MRVYWDTSALAKVYVHEQGSDQAQSWLKRDPVISSHLLPVELRCMLRRRCDDSSLTQAEAAHVLARLEQDRIEWLLLDIGSEVLGRAEVLVGARRLRTLDAIHLASALVLRERGMALPFLSADRRQTEAARGLGLETQLIS